MQNVNDSFEKKMNKCSVINDILMTIYAFGTFFGIMVCIIIGGVICFIIGLPIGIYLLIFKKNYFRDHWQDFFND